MKITKNLFYSKKIIGSVALLTAIGSLSSCTTENEDLSTSETLNSADTSAQFSQLSDFVPDTDKVYTITSESHPLLLSTDGSRVSNNTGVEDFTVRDLWKFVPSTVEGTYFIQTLEDLEDPTLIMDATLLQPVLREFRFEEVNSEDSSWSITSAGDGAYFITSLRDRERNRLGVRANSYNPSIYNITSTDETQETDLEKFVFTEVTFPFEENRAPIVTEDNLSLYSFDTSTVDVLSNDFDPDGDELTIESFSVNDDRVIVEIVDNKLMVKYDTNDGVSIDVAYFVSDGKGGVTEGNLNVFRRTSNF